MKTKRRLKRNLSAALVAAMFLTSTPADAFAAYPLEKGTVVTFDNADQRGDFALEYGSGTVEFQDGAGAQGYMHVVANGETFAMKAGDAQEENGKIEADLSLGDTEGRASIAFRYQSDQKYTCVGYDLNRWVVMESGNVRESFTGPEPSRDPENPTHVDVEYRGKSFVVRINGEEYLNKEVTALSYTDAGKVGIRVWGYGEGRTQGNVYVDNFRFEPISSVPDVDPEPVPQKDAITFDDVDHRGGFALAYGNGTVEFHDGANAEGYMRVKANGETFAMPAEGAELKDGCMEADLSLGDTEGRVSLAFRYISDQKYTCVGYDLNHWVVMESGKLCESFDGPAPSRDPNHPNHVAVEYRGKHLIVRIDGEECLNKEVTSLSYTEAGKAGIRVWGYDSGRTQGDVLVDNFYAREGNLPEYKYEDDFVSFDDKENRGSFEVVHTAGSGHINFVDGKDEKGYMKITAEGADTGETYVVATKGKNITDGFVEADMTNLDSEGRMAIVFKYSSSEKYSFVGYDIGDWAISLEGEPVVRFQAPALKPGKTHRVRVDMCGDTVFVSVDGKRVHSQTAKGFGEKSGKSGFRVWGYGTGKTQGKLKVDNFASKIYKPVLMSPDHATFSYQDAGKKDITITLSGAENKLESVVDSTGELRKDIDYTLSQDEKTLVLKKEYIAAQRDLGNQVVSIKFADGYESQFYLKIHAKPLEKQIHYYHSFEDGFKTWKTVTGSTTLEKQGKQTSARGAGIIIDEKSPELKNVDVEFQFNPKSDYPNYAIVARYQSPDDWVAIGQDSSRNWKIWNAAGESEYLIEDGDDTFPNRLVPYKIRVRVLENVCQIWYDGGEVFSGTSRLLNGGAGKAGVRLMNQEGLDMTSFSVTSAEYPIENAPAGEERVLESEQIQVRVDSTFPRVIGYTLKENQATLDGMPIPFHVVEVNGRQFKPEITTEFTANSAVYHMTVAVTDSEKITFDVILEVNQNNLIQRVENVNDKARQMYSFCLPQNLVSMENTRMGAELRTNNYYNGPDLISNLADRDIQDTYEATVLAVLSSNDIAATINNDSYNKWRGVAAQTIEHDGKLYTGLRTTNIQCKGLDGKPMEKLWTCVSIGADQNEDGKVDFQDGAILRRDDCQQEGQESDALYAETLLDSYTMVAMNFASQAQCPFLRISDNAKKLSLAMDDFPQHIIIKGYNAQGHDSCNGDYTKFNQAAGGLNDFNVMLEEGKKHNISYGVHINHTEMYPEYVGPTQDLRTSIQGWNWLDSARLINRYNDILDPVNDTRKRVQALNDMTNGNIEHIYVDVFFGTRWPMFTMIDQINSMGIAVSTEYPREMDKHSAFCHHIGERENFQSAGNLVRFVNHTYQDIFEQTPLFRGEHDRNFIGLYGYEGNSDFNKTVREFYLNVLPNRYLVQFPIMQYETTDKAVLGREYNIVARVQDGKNQILKDGHLLADGNKVFIPWDPETEDKIYHWNDEGGTTQWYLPKSWSSCQQVVMYPLSDKGRGAAVTLDVVDGQVTLTAEAKRGYVIYPSEKAPGSTDLTTMEWTKGGHIKDAGFDSFTPGYGWEITSNAGTTEHVRFENNNTGNTYLTVNGKNDAEIRQTAVELTPDKGYSAAVWTQVTDGREAAIEVWDGDQLLARNYMTRSNVKFGFSFRDCFGRYMHRMKVNFTAPKSGKVTVVCKAAEGLTDDAKVIFDDVRVMENEVSDLQGHDMLFDFENVDESVYPFVADGNSNHTHLSETNEGYTVDTISGQFSMKISDNHMRTLPITVRLEPNTTYEFNMDYLLDRPSNNGFTLGVKSDLAAEAGAKEAILENRNCGAPAAWTKQHVSLTFTTGNYDDYYIDLTRGEVGTFVVDNLTFDKRANDRESLQKLYDSCTKLDEKDYTTESYQELEKALKKAKTVLDNPSAGAEQYEEAILELTKAKDALVAYAKDADKERLKEQIEMMKQLNPDHYQQNQAWENFQSVIKEAEALLKRTKPQVTVTEIDTMIQKLADAKNGLATKTDKSELKDLYEICSKVSSSEVRDGQELVNFLAARSKAEELLADDGASQEDVNKAYEDLNAAFGLIVFRDGIANEKLDQLMEEARKALEEEKGTEEQRKALEDALKDAENAIKTQLVEDVMRSETALQNALNSLEKQWTVTFQIETEEQSIQVVDGQSVDRPENPVKDGYSFVGWYTEDGTKYDFSLPVTQDLRLIARFEKQDVVNPDPENPDGESGQKPEEKPSEPAGKPGDQTSDVDQNKNESVQTGDSIPATCIFMLFLSAVGILVIVKKRKRG